MNLPVAINKLSSEMGITSRTLRHWESEGLFTSIRDQESGWRAYDQEAILCIKITHVLRKLDIPLKDIKRVLVIRTFEMLESVIKKQILLLESDETELIMHKSMLYNLLSNLSKACIAHKGSSLIELSDVISTLSQIRYEEEEDIIMINSEKSKNNVRFITLPPMRMVYNIAVGISPEDDAMNPVIGWLKSSNLMGTARLFGGNVEPFPGKTNSEYGYGMCASIPENVEIPPHLKELRLGGGLYAMMPSTEDIHGSWQQLMKYLKDNNEYVADRSRMCLEEHIRNDNPEEQGNLFSLNLLKPVKRK